MTPELRIAYLLHRRPFRNTSLMVECLVEGEGRFPLVARGGAKGRLQGVLQPFQPLMISWSGKGEVKTLSKAEPASPPGAAFRIKAESNDIQTNAAG